MQNLIKRELRVAEPAAPEPQVTPGPTPDPAAEQGPGQTTASAGDTAAIVAAARAAAQDHQAAAARSPTCLLVDDSRMIRKVARRIVEQYGFAVLEAENGEEGIARCRQTMPDLVLTDWDMPVMTGPEFVAALRALPGSADTRVVFCTSKSGARDIHHGIGAGADDWIVKPFDDVTLGAKLAALGFA